MEIEFKSYSAEDQADVLDMMASFNQIDDYPFDIEIGERNLVEFTADESLGRLYLIQIARQNIGYVVLTFGFSFEYKGRDAFIDEFYIKRDYRNKGIGTMTMDFIESESRKWGVHAIHLEVEAHNTNAHKLYLNSGYISNERTLLTKQIKPANNHEHQ